MGNGLKVLRADLLQTLEKRGKENFTNLIAIGFEGIDMKHRYTILSSLDLSTLLSQGG